MCDWFLGSLAATVMGEDGAMWNRALFTRMAIGLARAVGRPPVGDVRDSSHEHNWLRWRELNALHSPYEGDALPMRHTAKLLGGMLGGTHRAYVSTYQLLFGKATLRQEF